MTPGDIEELDALHAEIARLTAELQKRAAPPGPDPLGPPMVTRKLWACGCEAVDDRREITWAISFRPCAQHRPGPTGAPEKVQP